MKKELNILRGIACFAVIIIHLTGKYSISLELFSTSSIITSFILIASGFAVPTFLFISGLLLRLNNKGISVDISKLYIKIFKSLVLPYLIWSVVYFLFRVSSHKEIGNINFLDNILFGNMYYHLYFMVVIIQLYIIYPILNRIYNKYNNLAITIFFIMLSMIFSNYRYLFGNFYHIIFIKWLGIFALGIFIGNNYEEIKEKVFDNRKTIFIINTMVTIGFVILKYLNVKKNKDIFLLDVLWIPFAISSIFTYFNLSIIIDKKTKSISKYLTQVSKESFSIYFFHPLIISVLDMIIDIKDELILNMIIKGMLTLIIVNLYIIFKYKMRCNIGNNRAINTGVQAKKNSS